ncbi:hypothetical protein [Pseudomonas sp. B21-048]|uniref:hypothetical protein n=1 Tax=Pseudomonas sp. B21-048 TaxID=2895490 RepID=UPI00215F9BD8|nr:hypothetical protein [Pseudomonas sp. B21-048]UVK98743.1 hypothetical protein LOY56_26215 [Pseudomonas sp. B21-048]
MIDEIKLLTSKYLPTLEDSEHSRGGRTPGLFITIQYGGSTQPNIHGNDYWKVHKAKKSEKDVIFGRVGHGDFKNYDLIKDFPVYVNGTLMNDEA